MNNLIKILEENKEKILNKIIDYYSINESNGCWEWKKAIANTGYGIINLGPRFTGKDKYISSHRLSAWIFLDFDLNSDLLICHKCDNRKCINPDHLFIGTHKDNMQDAKTKGRIVSIVKSGNNSPNHKLDYTTIKEIKDLYYNKIFSQTKIAQLYNVTQATISGIILNKTWRKNE